MIPVEETHSEELLQELHALRQRVSEMEVIADAGAQAEAEAMRLATGLAAVGRLAVDLGAAPRDANLWHIIGHSLREITGALFVLVTRYYASSREAVIEFLAAPNEVAERLTQVMGHKVVGMRVPLSDEYRAGLLSLDIRTFRDAASSATGAVPREASEAMSQALGIGHFAALALCHGDQLMGTAVLAMGTGQESPPPQVMRLFAYVAVVSLQRQEALSALHSKVAELRQAQAQLVHASNMAVVGELAAGIAHELNNPLTSILGSADYLLERGERDAKEVRRLEVIADQARRARDVVRGLLDYARCEKGSPEPLELNAIVSSSIDLLRGRLEHSGIVIDERYAPDLPLLSLDASKIRQVFLNLCANALYAMPAGGTLRVCTEQDGSYVKVCLADTGEGISSQDLERVFEPFFATRSDGQGSGLAISRGLVEEYDGRIEVESQVGAGSTFTVWLPLAGECRP